jgi:3-hydroxyisobutyrate dehydrogenase-like beta-hydroxyacid dehydrogenase
MQSNIHIGLVGLGLMGSALADRLMAAGVPVSGFDPEVDRRDALERNGGRAASLTELAQQCDALVLAVFDGAQVEGVFDVLERAVTKAPLTVICTTTCDPDCIDRIAARADRAGIAFVEAPISGTSRDVRAGEATALVSGANDEIERWTPLLTTMCPCIVPVGKIGDASRIKLAINLVLQSNRAALAEGIVFAETIGLDPVAFLTAVRASAAYSRVMDAKGEKMLQRDFRPQSRIAQTLKDAELILNEARKHQLTLPMTSTQATLLRQAIALKGGECDSAAVIAAIELGSETEGNKP